MFSFTVGGTDVISYWKRTEKKKLSNSCREIHNQKGGETDRQTDREREREREAKTERETVIQRERET